MNTEQKYVSAESNPTPIEPKAIRPKDELYLYVQPGDSVDLLYHLLSAERDRLAQLAPWKLIENDFEYFQEIMKDIDGLNFQMASLFCALNDRLKTLTEQSKGEKTISIEESEASQERMALMEKVMKLRTEQLEELQKQTNSTATN